MPKIKEQEHVRIKEKSTQEGKEQITKVADEKMVTTKAEAEKTEAPKKKKNIIRVYHAQNASDGGKKSIRGCFTFKHTKRKLSNRKCNPKGN